MILNAGWKEAPRECDLAAVMCPLRPRAYPGDRPQTCERSGLAGRGHRFRREIECVSVLGEADRLVGPVAERLLLRGAAAAERNDGAPRKPVDVPFGIDDLETLPFDAEVAVSPYGDSNGHDETPSSRALLVQRVDRPGGRNWRPGRIMGSALQGVKLGCYGRSAGRSAPRLPAGTRKGIRVLGSERHLRFCCAVIFRCSHHGRSVADAAGPYAFDFATFEMRTAEECL